MLCDPTAADGAEAPGRSPRRAAPAARTGPNRTGERSRPAPLGAPPVPQAARDLLADAGRGVGRAVGIADAPERFAAAHLAALRAAAAVLAARARPVRGRRGSAWELIARVAPELSEWGAFFAAGSAKRHAVEAGLAATVTAREADDMVRQTAVFLDVVEELLSRRSA
ncbi:hypothetical protein JL106_18260 [Nakamurella sp. YIM 132084]|uniref:SAV-6107-like HEPN domain-containing protein n=2 Tax=Nakamurella leprariae TaxID=2803911 RepID=A0A938YG26_9ACTN|nr:hypothetical protein [Nakamurella leprariae]